MLTMRKPLLAAIALFFTQFTCLAQVIFQDNFESYPTGTINNGLKYDATTGKGWWQVQNSITSKLIFPQSGCPSVTPDQHKIVNNGAYQGAQCVRAFYNTNELWSGNSNGTGCRWRTELAQRLGNNGLATSGSVEVWYGFMVKPMKTNGLQWTKRCMGTTGNDVACSGLRDNLETHISQFVADESGASAVLIDIQHGALDQSNPRYFNISNIGRTENVLWDQWNSIVMHVITGNGGKVEAWVNGVYYTSNTIASSWVATWTHDFKIGIYGDRIDQQAEAFFDDLKFAKGPNQFAAVNPVASVTPTVSTAPAKPTNLVINNFTPTSVNLTWAAPVNSTGVTAYQIFQNNVFLKSVTTTTSVASGLTPSTNYSFYVVSVNVSGIASAPSNAVPVTTPATLPPTSNYLPNGGVESGLADWGGNNATVALLTSGVRSGTKALNVTGRNQNWSCGQYDITNILNTNGPGNYTADIWARMASGTMAGNFQVKITANGATTQQLFQAGTLNTSWSKLSGTLNLAWTGTVTSAYIFVDGNNKTSYRLDDAVLKK